MQARFLLGPAGSGKTFRCLAEVRAALANDSNGNPLVFLAPKQATFQLERQLLADESLQGYTRLHIFSFERLAQFVLDGLGITPPRFLSDEGRVMVLRALLIRHAGELELFRSSARRPGFAQELGRLLNELQQHQLTSDRLRVLARQEGLHRELRGKLYDLALLLEKYSGWLATHKLQDGNHLLEAATTALRQKTLNSQLSTLNVAGLWLDGFAEMTPQELDLLAAMIPDCESATLAFCLDQSAAETGENSWLSIWSAVGKTFQQCRQRIEDLKDCEVTVEALSREPGKTRFEKSPSLAALEQYWSRPTQNPAPITDRPSSIRVIACPNAEAEAVFAAREILKFARAGGRFRECAVLVRNLDAYQKPLERAFVRYEIPFFLDRRESVAHHPLAELTRSSFRTVTFDWQQDDWFATLKAGFSPVPEEAIDDLENAALEFGWRGKKWREPLPDEASEQLRKIVFPPFAKFSTKLANGRPTGTQLAEALRELWSDLNVEETLERWTLDEANPAGVRRPAAIHQTVWDQMNEWLDNLDLAFSKEQLSLRDWLPVLEAGLANLTVGVVPPALDQVLVGAIDRARNPDLKLALVLGVNETVFPATPAAQTILTDADRDELPITLGPDLRERLARERYYGYIACTRSGEKLVVTLARQDAEGTTLNPSPFIAQLRHDFPGLEIEEFGDETTPADAGHVSEIAPLILNFQDATSGDQFWQELLKIPSVAALQGSLVALREPDEDETLAPALAEKLYGPVLRSSVSRLEEFAQCPFRFFVRAGLHAGERKVFELDARERGNFQHDVLKIFHEQLSTEGKRWRDVEPAEARVRVGKIVEAQMEHFRDGLFRDSAATVFAARTLAESLQDFVAVIVTWMRAQYEFDPAEAELGFGGKDDRAPAWEIALGGRHQLALQGRIDRVDLWRDPAGDATLAVVTDYKSGGKKLDKLLVEHGVQLQLLAYLGALRHWKNPREISGREKIIPAGAFYVNLRGDYNGGGSRAEILAEADESRRKAYRHTGRFDAGALDKLDRIRARDQFNYRLKNNGELYAGSTEAMPRAEFEKLIDGIEAQLRTLGERIFSGAAQVDPYRKGKQTPCEYCDYSAACRIDKWTHSYRVLRSALKAEAEAD